MPEERSKQLNVRLEEKFFDLMERLAPVVSDELGLRINQADLIRLGLKCLEKTYLPEKKAKPKST